MKLNTKHIILVSLIIFLLFVAYATYRYFEIQEKQSQKTVVYDLPNNKQDKGQIIRDHLVNKEKIRTPIITNKSDSNKTQCTKPPSPGQKIKTRIAGYVIEYPCTVRNQGSIRTYFDENNSSYSEYSVYIWTQINEDESIWKLTQSHEYDEMPSFRINLKSNGRRILKPPMVSLMINMMKVSDDTINGLIFYRDSSSIKGYLVGTNDASGNPPVISCQAGENIAVEDIFSLLPKPTRYGYSCTGGWAITEHIYLSIKIGKKNNNFIYHFKDLYRIINSGLTKSIISTPLPKY